MSAASPGWGLPPKPAHSKKPAAFWEARRVPESPLRWGSLPRPEKPAALQKPAGFRKVRRA